MLRLATRRRGQVLFSRDKGVVFIAAHIAKLDPGRTFEMWVIPARRETDPSGTFKQWPIRRL